MIPPVLLRSTATVSPLLTSGAFGNKYGTPVKIKCRLEKQLRKNGNREQSNMNTYIMFCNPNEAIQEGAQVIVDSRCFVVEDVQEVPSMFDIDHLEVMLSGYTIQA